MYSHKFDDPDLPEVKQPDIVKILKDTLKIYGLDLVGVVLYKINRRPDAAERSVYAAAPADSDGKTITEYWGIVSKFENMIITYTAVKLELGEVYDVYPDQGMAFTRFGEGFKIATSPEA